MIYLASASPRRAELLRQIGVKFDIIRAEIDESPGHEESIEDLVLRLSREKALRGLELCGLSSNHDLVLAADTLIGVDGHILGKPESIEHCQSMLEQLSGRPHQVFSAVAVANSDGRVNALLSVNEVTFRNINAAEIKHYCASAEAHDKAGAYAIQGKAAIFIEHLAGSYSAVMGLPLFETAQLLQQAGYQV
jgi:septum formation protein